MAFVYGSGALALVLGSGVTNTLDFLNQTMQVGLSTSTHVPNQDDNFLDDGGADDFIDGELSGTGYSRQTLASKTVTYDTANNRVEFDAADTTWTGINAGTAAQATVHRDNTTDATSTLFCDVDTGGFPVTTNGGDVTIQWNAEGIVQLTV